MAGAETMAADSDSEFLDAAQSTMCDVGDGQLTQLQEQLVATLIENETISWFSLHAVFHKNVTPFETI